MNRLILVCILSLAVAISAHGGEATQGLRAGFGEMDITPNLDGKPVWLAVYAALSWFGLTLYYRVKKLGVAVHNGLRFPKLRPLLLRFRETVLQNLPPDRYG